ncbi:EbsA family protein [Apilactobacillus quenuiae]|uniref:EbsA family protein n=1 Tax=Apilactobacillus quenuiae TaxID=2008377 RepID=UPI000D015CF7|nr:EbsA family protein [Apilactobacillus quenuiae]
MITQKRTFLYQPGIFSFIITWSWTFALLFVGIIFWLEVTHFQQITLFFFIIFLLFSIFQLLFRKIIIEDNQITIGRLLNPKWISVNISDIDNYRFTKHRAILKINGKNHEFLLPVNSIIELNSIISKKG